MMIEQEHKIKQLKELGYETKVENGTLFIYKDVWEDRSADEIIYSLMSDYKGSYGVRPKERKQTKVKDEVQDES